jgi:hypothetical protein
MGLDNIFLSPALGFLFAIHSDWVGIFDFGFGDICHALKIH